ncbi:sensor histidine kinase [Oscillospiraceae bacterium HV4-5-C5C]|nr:sensor histidine kinase [Oscillospiraceae bacterium HV4-5-C5C]
MMLKARLRSRHDPKRHRSDRPYAPKTNRLPIKKQILLTFLVAVLGPVLIIGSVSSYILVRNMYDRYSELIAAEGTRIRSVMFDLTSSLYSDSNRVVSEQAYRDLLGRHEAPASDSGLRQLNTLLTQIKTESGSISEIGIYTDNPAVLSYDQIHYTTDFSGFEWYQKTDAASWDSWITTETAINKNQSLPELTLVRRINISRPDCRAYLVLHVSYNYINNRTATTDYHVMISAGSQEAFFSTVYGEIGQAIPYPLSGSDYYSYAGLTRFEGKRSLVNVSSFKCYATDSLLYILAVENQAPGDIRRILLLYCLVLLISIAFPSLAILRYSRFLSRRVLTIKDAMHQTSLGNFEIINSFSGEDELASIYQDLMKTAEHIRQSEQRRYTETIQQQQMEYRLLVNQINPHFLYNTLEMIRMQAVSANDQPVAQSILLLARSMQYVLLSNNARTTTLARELEMSSTYLQIQKLRFGDRVNWDVYLDPGLDPQQYQMIPLLLQPLIENAITHGLEQRKADGHISLIIEARQEQLVLSVSDNGAGMKPEQLQSVRAGLETSLTATSRHIGLSNIHHRIQLHYGPAYGLRLQSTAGSGTIVSMVLPLHPEPAPAGQLPADPLNTAGIHGNTTAPPPTPESGAGHLPGVPGPGPDGQADGKEASQ